MNFRLIPVLLLHYVIFIIVHVQENCSVQGSERTLAGHKL